MKYKNEKLQVTIESAELFEIVERPNHIELRADGVTKFHVCAESTVRAFGSSSVEAFGSSTVEAYDSSTVRAYGSSTVYAHDSSTVWAYGSSSVEAYDSSTVEAHDSSTVRAHDSSTVRAFGSSSVVAYDSSTVEAYDSSSVEAFGSSSVVAYGSSSVVAYGSSSVVAYDSSTVWAYDSSTVMAHDSSSVRAYDSSTVRAYYSSTVVAYNFCCVFVKSVNSKVKPENHFGAIIQQVFKTTKKTIVFKKLKDNLIAELVLSKGQIFQSENHGKCRTDRAEVLSITDVDGKKYLEGHSTHDHTFVYTVGAVVSAPYDKEVKECSTGIHFFLTREEAERY